jgi:gliding motility-associated-like protein
VDVNLFNERLTNNICYNNRWHLNNGNGYIALYDPTGFPVDAIYWATNVNNINTGGEFDNILCSPGGPCTPAVLGMAKDITSIFYVGDCSSSAVGAALIGKTVSRSIDGGPTWSLGSNPSQGSCNGVCQPIGASIGLTITTIGTSCGQDTGKAIVTVTSGTGPFAYSINGGTSQTDSVFDNLPTGSYTLQVFAAGCAKDTTFTINQIGVGPVIDSVKIIQPGCTSNGTVIIHATPAGSLQYSVNGGALQSDSTFTNLTSGSYTFLVDGGCTSDTLITLTSINNLTIDSVVIKPTNCGASNGSIHVYASGESGIQYALNGGASQAGGLFSGLGSGTDTVVISAGSCNLDTLLVIQSVGQLSANISTLANCGLPCDYNGPRIMINEVMIVPSTNDGSIYGETSLSGKEGEWIELFNPDKCNPVDISCFVLGNFEDTEAPFPPPTRTDGAGFVLPQGTVVPPLGFVVVRGRNAPVPPIGVIDIVVDNIGGRLCIDGGLTQSRMWFRNTGGWFAFYDNNGLPIDAIKWGTPTTVSLAGNPCLPSASCAPAGTVLPSASAMGSLVSNLGSTPGTDLTYRRIPDGGTWSVPAAPTYGTCNSTCLTPNSGSCNGSAKINVTTGTAPYTYSWVTGGNGTVVNDSIYGLCEGNYSVTVTDVFGCSATLSFVINGKPVIIDVPITNSPSCNANDGSIFVSANGNGASISYQLNNNVPQADSVFSGLASGTYLITVSSGQCSADTNITLVSQNGPDLTSVNIIKPEACGQNNASFELNAIGGSIPYSYFVNAGTPQTDSVFINQSAQNYWAYVSDVNGCIDSLSFNITEIPAPVIAISSQVDEKCDKTNGSISVNSTGGSSPYTFQLNGVSQNNTINYNGLPAGTYQVIVTDANNCKDTVVVLLNNIPGPVISLLDLEVEHCDQKDGSVQVNVLGGSTPIQYSIDNGLNYVSSPLFNNLIAGTYFVEVKDANDCKADSVINLAEQNISVSLVGDPLYSETIPQPVNLTATSSTAIQYSWNFGDGNGAITATGQNSYTYNQGGEFIVEVTAVDAFGCVASDTIRVIISQLFIPNIFTPNGDVNNNEFKITQSGYKDLNCVIFNRWGLKVFEFNGLNGVWDGKTQSGGNSPDGTYYYLLTATTINGETKEFSGYITLTR